MATHQPRPGVRAGAGRDQDAARDQDAGAGHAGPGQHTVPGQDALRDKQAVRRFVERVRIDAGRVRHGAHARAGFAALLATDSGALTAAELAEMLQVSPAAISGAVRYLRQISMVSRERAPGSRRDHYRLYDEVFPEMISRRNQLIARWADGLREGLGVLGAETPAGARIAETVAFFEFLQLEVPAVIKRWREHKGSLLDERQSRRAAAERRLGTTERTGIRSGGAGDLGRGPRSHQAIR